MVNQYSLALIKSVTILLAFAGVVRFLIPIITVFAVI